MPTAHFPDGTSPKWSDAEVQNDFRRQLFAHYGLEREFQVVARFSSVYDSLWYAHRHSTWREIASAFHEAWTEK